MLNRFTAPEFGPVNFQYVIKTKKNLSYLIVKPKNKSIDTGSSFYRAAI